MIRHRNNKTFIYILKLVKLCLPSVINKRLSIIREKYYHNKYKNLSGEELFTKIYENKQWGEDKYQPFFSGSGSHNKNISTPYIDALTDYITGLDFLPVIIDIGSGDFNIGSKLVHLAKYYYACDIVKSLQNFCNKKFNYDNLEFVVCDAVNDPLPLGDIVIIRQVLQHLSNAEIKEIIKKCRQYNRWIITEHIPVEKFEANKDFRAGSGIRILYGSGIDLTKSPFSIKGYQTRVLCETFEGDGIIKTVIFEKCKNAVSSDMVSKVGI